MNQLVVHQGVKGTENESSLARIVQNLVPTRYGVGSGLLIDAEGNFSKQMDLVIYEQGDEPALLAQTNQVLFPVENVRLCIEVKTGLGKRQIEDAREKKASIDALKSFSGKLPPLALFAFRGDIEADTIADHLNEAMTAQGPRPDLTAVISLALLVGDLKRTGGAEDWVRGVAGLQDLDANGNPTIGTIQLPGNTEGDKSAIRSDILYPVVRVNKVWAIAEPSRAMLLFSEWLVATLLKTTSRPVVMSAYITAEGRDLTAV
ncbi:DUF6602 domain-containing protein [Cryobacterium sp. TMT2-4]|uniref:DUF6602 domain-containing protein n=1 Tax=Cryobacterium sp. TMT2-4 TaxID=1259254 RepID=UPI001069DC90|nr:DUF6602 domain-containing protein [Cryobacterium sp. TMT2-4]TFC71614.1 hypothetical protein E3O54_00320 [Cryobacterium sp. TMT2-4]